MQNPVRNAKGLAPELVDRARRRAWLAHRRPDAMKARELGSGHFSRVYEFEDGLVLKVAGPGGYGIAKGYVGMTSEHDGRPIPDAWPEYIEWTAQLKRRPSWAPKVYHMECITAGVYFAVMERLYDSCMGLTEYSDSVRVPVRILRQMADARGLRKDLHDRNFMMRNGRTTVVTDPWCYRTY